MLGWMLESYKENQESATEMKLKLIENSKNHYENLFHIFQLLFCVATLAPLLHPSFYTFHPSWVEAHRPRTVPTFLLNLLSFIIFCVVQ